MSLSVCALLGEGGPVSRRLEGFEVRPQQVEMAAAVERTLESRGRLLVEAGTGVGKSFAYLAPVIRRIVENEERVIVSTNTINLQEQLIEKDIPLLRAVVPNEFSAVLVKGRNNYVSLRRLKLASDRQERLFADDDARHALHLIQDWAYETRDGSLSTLPPLPRPEVWDYAQSDTHNCMGRRCPTYDKCFYQAARRRMENGDLLVCNHALFFADLALRSQGVRFLPPYDHVVLDEAHAIEDVASQHFGVALSEARVGHLLNLLYQPRAQRGFLSTMAPVSGSGRQIDVAIEQVLRCREAADALFGSLVDWAQRHGPPNGRVRSAGIVQDPLRGPMRQLAAALKLLRETATESDGFELNSYALRTAQIADDLESLLDQRLAEGVYWLELRQPRAAARRRRRRPGVALHCRPVEIGPFLAEQLFDRDASVILTSATLATGPGQFGHVTQRLGCPGAATLQLGSPFDHASQMKVLIDSSMPPPHHPDYAEALAPRILEQIKATGGGAFVLFTSFSALNRVADALRPLLEDEAYPVLVQDRDGPRGLLLRRFRGDDRSVLFGTASFWQGVDVRGRALRNVIITRLPFDVPDQPLLEARHERIKARGGEPFLEDQVPRAVIRFKQGVGRLIRSATDSGRVVVLDTRIVTKWYGRKFLEALPEGVEIRDLAEESDEVAE